MKTHPILFSSEMILAILEGRKTQTRRVMKPQPSFEPKGWKTTHSYENDHKIKIGDVLWVRETLYQNGELALEYFADNTPIDEEIIPNDYNVKLDNDGNYKFCKIPSIYMPKFACRIFLKVTDVRLVRLQDISDSECDAEGIHFEPDECNENERYYRQYENGSRGFYTWSKYNYKGDIQSAAKASFCTLWLRINGENSWDSNPYVWAYSFEITKKPISF